MLKTIVFSIWASFMIFQFSGCAIYNNPVVFNVDKEHKVSKPLDPESKVVITNDNSRMIITTNNNHPQTVQTEVPHKTKVITKIVKVGCPEFVKPLFQNQRKLTLADINALKSKTSKDINMLLLDVIEQNYKISKANQAVFEVAYQKHIAACTKG